MLTLFTTAKPFRGHNGIIQRNALQSWKRLDPNVEIIVFGEDEGSAEVSAELGLRHEPIVERSEFGTILVSVMFARAQAIARHDVLCFVNCDIILMADFCRAVSQTRAKYGQYLMVGRRWDTDITEAIDFSTRNWEEQIRHRALGAGCLRDQWWIDYFVFSRGLYGPEMPSFAIGRTSWDNWLVWKVCNSGYPVVDATASILAVHQNHDYGHHAQGAEGVWKGEEAKRNFQLAGGWSQLCTISDATVVLKDGEFRNNSLHSWVALERQMRAGNWAPASFLIYKVWLPLWHGFLGITRPVRHALGLRSRG